MEQRNTVDTRTLKTGHIRFRFRLYPEQYEIVRMALDQVKSEAGTEYDHVALELICQHFFATYGFPAFEGGAAEVVARAKPVLDSSEASDEAH